MSGATLSMSQQDIDKVQLVGHFEEKAMYDARKVSSLLQFMGGKPMLTLRDHTNGRIKVFKGNDWIATIVPGSIWMIDQQACLLSYPDSEIEWRGSYDAIAFGLSALQQTEDWFKAEEAFESATETEAWLGF